MRFLPRCLGLFLVLYGCSLILATSISAQTQYTSDWGGYVKAEKAVKDIETQVAIHRY